MRVTDGVNVNRSGRIGNAARQIFHYEFGLVMSVAPNLSVFAQEIKSLRWFIKLKDLKL